MKSTVEADVAIFGGGVAGLWLLNRLRQSGYSAILFESNTLGGCQTHKAQGIIHGGMKFALHGALTSATHAISHMPTVWEHCLQGRGDIDLSRVPVLSNSQYLWSTGFLSSKIAGFFAGLTLHGQVQELKKEDFPEVFQNTQFKGQIYSLDEIVIDVNALIRELVKPNQDAIFKIDEMKEKDLEFDQNGNLKSLTITRGSLPSLKIHAQRFVFTAGAGNEILKNQKIATQRRPLHMVIAKTDFSYPLYAHCIGLSTVPRITITTHTARDGKTIWYMGGQIAEEGVKRSEEQQIAIAKQELQTLFPWLDFSNVQFATFLVDRAEPMQTDGKRPDSFYFKEIENVIAAWPTKLAFAPQLANEIIEHLKNSNIKPGTTDIRPLRAWPLPSFSIPVWDQLL